MSETIHKSFIEAEKQYQYLKKNYSKKNIEENYPDIADKHEMFQLHKETQIIKKKNETRSPKRQGVVEGSNNDIQSNEHMGIT